MVIDVTYACNMGCSHCMSDCKPDGQHMSIDTFKDVLKFLKKHDIPTWAFSGGEIFEHPDIYEILDVLEQMWDKKYPISFITNGRALVRNKALYERVVRFKNYAGKRHFLMQITDDPRFYPDPLTQKEKYWLSKLADIIEPVPGNPKDRQQCLYPQGRALVNHTDANWYMVGPKCANTRLATLQGINTIHGLVMHLFVAQKFCVPVIAPDGSIKLGESALCPSVASIYDDERTIIEKIRNSNCKACKIAWDNLKEKQQLAYTILELQMEKVNAK